MSSIESSLYTAILSEAFELIKKSRKNEHEQEIIDDAVTKTSEEISFLNDVNARILFDVDRAEEILRKYESENKILEANEWESVVNDDLIESNEEINLILGTFAHSFEQAAISHPEYGDIHQLKYNKEIVSKLDILAEKIVENKFKINSESSELEKALTNHMDEPIGYYRDYSLNFTIEDLTSRIEYWSLKSEFEDEYQHKLRAAYSRNSEALLVYAEEIIGSDIRDLHNLPLKDVAIAIGYNGKLQERDIWEIVNSEPVEKRANSYLYLGVRTLEDLQSL